MAVTYYTYKVEREGESDPFFVRIEWYKNHQLTTREQYFFHTAEEREEFLRGVAVGYRGPSTQ